MGQDLIIYVQVIIYYKALLIKQKNNSMRPNENTHKRYGQLRFNMQLLL